MFSIIFDAIARGWEPICPTDLAEFHRCFDWEKPGDEEFLARLKREATQWMQDNI